MNQLYLSRLLLYISLIFKSTNLLAFSEISTVTTITTISTSQNGRIEHNTKTTTVTLDKELKTTNSTSQELCRMASQGKSDSDSFKNESCNSRVCDEVYATPHTSGTSEIIVKMSSQSGDLCTIGTKHSSDKFEHHGYHRFFARYLESYRYLSGEYAMLEIGIDRSNSLQAWLEYFPYIYIYGMDINIQGEGYRDKVLKVDQGDMAQVHQAVESEIKHPIFLIIDDGSHVPEHQINCFDYLFSKLLLPGGTYIIEDIETSYWKRSNLYQYKMNYGYLHPNSVIEIMKGLADDVNNSFMNVYDTAKHNEKLNRNISELTRRMVSSVTFAKNCIIIVKKTLEEIKVFENDSRYRFFKSTYTDEEWSTFVGS